MAKSKTNTADGSKGNGGMMPHGGKSPRAKKGANKPGGKAHPPVPGPMNSTC